MVVTKVAKMDEKEKTHGRTSFKFAKN